MRGWIVAIMVNDMPAKKIATYLEEAIQQQIAEDGDYPPGAERWSDDALDGWLLRESARRAAMVKQGQVVMLTDIAWWTGRATYTLRYYANEMNIHIHCLPGKKIKMSNKLLLPHHARALERRCRLAWQDYGDKDAAGYKTVGVKVIPRARW